MIYCLSLSSLALFIQDNIPNLIQNIKRSTCEGEHVEQQYNHYKHKKILQDRAESLLKSSYMDSCIKMPFLFHLKM